MANKLKFAKLSLSSIIHNINMENLPQKNEEQLKIDFEKAEQEQLAIEQEKKETIELLQGSYPLYFKEENLIRQKDKWCIMRLGKCLSIGEWIKETEDDISYHANDGKKNRYGE